MKQEDMIKSFDEFKNEPFDETKIKKIFCPHCGLLIGWIKNDVIANVTFRCNICNESCGAEIDKNGKTYYIHGNDNLVKEDE